MFTRVIFIVFLLFLGTAARAGQTLPDRHIVQKGDTWYALSKKYNVSYADLRLENKNLSDQLRVGDTLRVPKPADVKHDTGRKASNELTPVLPARKHKVKSGETLTSIAKRYKCSVADLKNWNKLSGHGLRLGQVLVVSPSRPVAASTPVPRKDSASASKAVAVPVQVPLKDSVTPLVTKRDSVAGAVRQPAVQPLEAPSDVTFAKGRKEMMEEGAVVWIEDEEINPGKYFALHRLAPIGTIVKVTNRMNRRVVFVKVVGKLPDTGENEGIILKISKAAAEKLGVLDARFQAQLNYGVEAP